MAAVVVFSPPFSHCISFCFQQTVSEAFREANLAASFGKAINF